MQQANLGPSVQSTEGAKDSGLMSASGSIVMNTTITAGTATVAANVAVIVGTALRNRRSRTLACRSAS
jgi:hypothetical protein